MPDKKMLNKLEGQITEDCGVSFLTLEPDFSAKANRIITMKDGSIHSDQVGVSV